MGRGVLKVGETRYEMFGGEMDGEVIEGGLGLAY